MRKHFLFIVSLALAVSCGRERLESVALPGGVYSVECEGYDNVAEGPVTRSANFDEQSQKVADLNIWVYEHDSNGSAVNAASGYRTYFTTATDIDGDLLFPDPDRTYDIYLFTNVGQITPPATNALAAAYKYGFTSYDSFRSKGFPMAAHYCFRPSDPSQSHSLKVKRLVSKYNVKFNFAGATNYDFELQSAYVCQSASAIVPFAKESAAASQSEVFRTADELSVADLQSKGGELYMLENMQGICFSEGDVRSEETIVNSKKAITTYLAFEGRLDKHDGTGYNKVTCRYYFGSGVECAVKRNLITDLKLNMTNSVEDHDNWVVTPEDPYNNGYVKFFPEAVDLTADGDWYYCEVVPYSDKGKDPDVKYTMSWNTTAWNTAGLSMQMRPKGGSDSSWAPYTGSVMTGEYELRFKSTSTSKNVLASSLSVQTAKGTEVQKDHSLPLNVNPKLVTDWEFQFTAQQNNSNLNSGYTVSISNVSDTETYVSSPTYTFSAVTGARPGTVSSRILSGTASKHLVKDELYRVYITRIYGSSGMHIRSYNGTLIRDIVGSAELYLTGEQLGITSTSTSTDNKIRLNFELFYDTSFTNEYILMTPSSLTLTRGKRSEQISIQPSNTNAGYKLTCPRSDVVKIYLGNGSTLYNGETLYGNKTVTLEYVGTNDTGARTVLSASMVDINCSNSIQLTLDSRIYFNYRDEIWVDEPYYPAGNRRVIQFELVDPDTVVILWDENGQHSYHVTAKEGGYFNGGDAPFNDRYVTFYGEGGLWNSVYHKYNNGIMIQFWDRSDRPEATLQIGPEIIHIDPNKFPVN